MKSKFTTLAAALFAVCAVFADRVTIGEHTWKFIVSGEAAIITGVTPATGALEIPGVIVVGDNEYTVTGIGDTAFEDSDRLRSVSLPTNLVCIGAYAFADCTALTGMVIPRSVTNVGERAFAGCAGLKSVTVPQCVASDGLWQAFDAEKIVKAVIADGVGSLGAGAFAGCYNLTSVTIPSSVTNMGDSVFEDCSSLKRVVIPRGVARIGKGAFYSCFELESVTIPNSVTKIADDAFSGCLSLTRVTIPAGVTAVGAGAFEECASLENVTIPSGVEQIGEGAFWGCSGLTRVTISQNFCNRDAWSAAFDTMLAADVVIADGTVEIGDSTFDGYEYITHVSIPESVERIGGRAFYGCASLSDVSFAEAVRAAPHGDRVVGGVRCIGDSAFEGCAALKSARLPSCVTNIGGQAFAGCGGLRDVSLPKCVFDLGLREVFGEYQWSGERPCPWETVEVGEGVAEIGDGAFACLPELRRVSLPCSVARIGCDAFCRCPRLEVVAVRKGVAPVGYGGVREVGDSAFEGCGGLVRVDVPGGVARIGVSAFQSCGELRNIVFEGDAPRVDGGAFEGVVSSCMVWVKRGSTGWGVAIPGRWQGLKISYRTYLPFDVSCDENLVATRSDHGVVISSVDGTVLTVNDLATVKIMAEMMDGSLADTTEGYNRVLSTDGTSAVFRLKTPEIGVSADEGDVERDPDDPSGTLVKVSGFKRAATPHTEYGESVGTLPVKTVRGLWYQVSWGADLQNMTQGVKVQATGNTLYLGVIKQTGTSGFYKLSVSGK